jgi:hypothetical protein
MVHLPFVGGTPLSPDVISAHQRTSEGIQKHSNDTPKYVQSTPKYVQMHPISGVDFVLSSCAILG